MIVSDWKLKEKIHLIMRDNALNMVRAMTDNSFSNAGRLLHTIHLVVMNSIFNKVVYNQ